MRILFMGTSEFAIPALTALISHKFELIGVVTQPDRPKGRGKRLTPSVVKRVATEHNLPVYQPEKVRQPGFISTLKQLAPDVTVVAAFGQILPQSVLDIPLCGTINLHPSLLPKYRGAAPIQWALINGETETGVTLMLLDAGEDTGDIICTERFPICATETVETLTHKLACIGARQLVALLSDLPRGAPPPATPQNHAEATHAPRLTKATGHINWHAPATVIHNLIRGTATWPGAYTFFRDEQPLKIIQGVPHSQNQQTKQKGFTIAPGTLEITSERALLVATGEGVLQLLQVQPATKKVMDVGDFINGYHVKTGESFSASVGLRKQNERS